MALKIEGPNPFAGYPQLGQWKAIVSGLGENGFAINETTIGELSPGCGQAVVTNLTHPTGDYILASSCIGWQKEGGLNVSRLDFKKPLEPDFDITLLPESPIPKRVLLIFSQEDYPDGKAREIRSRLIAFGQQSIGTNVVSGNSRIEEWSLQRGEIRVNFAFTPPTSRRNCGFEMDANPTPRQMFKEGRLPYHVDQTQAAGDNHYCIAAAELPLIPVAVDDRTKGFVLSYDYISSLPDDYQRLFRGIELFTGFSVSYGGNPHMSIYARIGKGYFRNFLGMDIVTQSITRLDEYPALEPTTTVQTIVQNLELFNKFYDDFQVFPSETHTNLKSS